MKLVLLCVWVLLAGLPTGTAQTKTKAKTKRPARPIACLCPGKTQADTSFTFSNKRKMLVCGYHYTKDGAERYSSFTFRACPDTAVVALWNATQTCTLEKHGDTLLVYNMRSLPVGKWFRWETTSFAIERFYFEQGHLTRTMQIDPRLGVYDEEAIKKVIERYHQAPVELSEETETVMAQLFIATMSGSAEAEQHLQNFRLKYTNLNGTYAVFYQELMDMLQLYTSASR